MTVLAAFAKRGRAANPTLPGALLLAKVPNDEVEVIETTLRVNRPPAGRLEPIKNSTQGLSELRITPKGKKGGPHLRMACLREGRTLWVAHGFTKQSNALHRRDINAADSIAEQWRAQR